MSIRLSAGMKNALLGNYGVRAMMNYGYIDVYTGTQPLLADLAPTGARIGRITAGGIAFVPGTVNGGLKLAQTSSGQLAMDGDTWTLIGVANGVAGWWRWKWNAGDTDDTSLYYPRIDGDVGTALTLTDLNVTTLTNTPINNFLLQFLEG